MAMRKSLSKLLRLVAFVSTCMLLTSCAESSNSNDWKVVSTLHSPKGEYVATVYTISGGGAAGWCEQRIEITSRNKPFDLERTKKEANFCFSASCGSKLQVIWKSETSLRIKYTIDDAGVSIYQRRIAPGLPVRIDYDTE